MPIPIPPLPPDNTQICLTIPNSAEYRQIVMGALNILTQWWYWDVNNPVDSEDVVQRMMSCIAITGSDYEGCMELDCNDVLACITNPETGIMQAIIDSVSLQTAEQFRANGQSQSGLIFGSGVNPACDLDILWGGIRSVIDLANDNNIDVLQILEVVTNPFEFVQEVILGIFGVELPIIQSIVDWIGWVQDNILENYEAEITTAYLNEVMCDLFCLTQDSCQLSPETLTNYFYTRLGSSLTIGSLLDETIAFLIGGVWVGTQIADVFFLSQFAFRAQLGKWFRLIGFLSVDTDFRIGANTPDNDWSILCTDCPDTWLSQWLGGEGDPVTDAWVKNYGTYDAMADTITGVSASDAKYIELVYTFDETVTITDISFTVDIKSPTSGNNIIYIRNASNTIIQSTVTSVVEATVTERTISWSGSQIVGTGWKIVIASNARILAQSPSNVMKAIAVSGEGTNPFV